MNLKLHFPLTLIALVTSINLHPKTTVSAAVLFDLSAPIESPAKGLHLSGFSPLADKTLEESKVSKTRKNPQFNCDEPITQVEMNQCAVTESVQTEKQLKQIYHQLETQNSGDVERLQLLKQNQLLWLKYRETSCQYASSQYEGGSIQPLIYSSCITSLTKERVENLESYLLP